MFAPKSEDAGGSVNQSTFNNISGVGIATIVGFGILITIITLVISLFIQVMTFLAELQVTEGKKPAIGELFNIAKKYWLRLFGLNIVIGLMFIGGLLLLIVPAVFVLRRYFLAPYYMLDKDLSIGEALKQSAADSKAASGPIWGIIGVSFLIALTGIVPIIGWAISFVLSMLYSAAPALRYREIRRNTVATV